MNFRCHALLLSQLQSNDDDLAMLNWHFTQEPFLIEYIIYTDEKRIMREVVFSWLSAHETDFQIWKKKPDFHTKHKHLISYDASFLWPTAFFSSVI